MHADIPALFALYRAGRLKLDELVTGTYSLEQINEAFAAMSAGTNARGLIVFDDPAARPLLSTLSGNPVRKREPATQSQVSRGFAVQIERRTN